jgi:outer membrane protein assembly factor BamE (lipoprotein component of BamABCDE complex)
MPIGEILFSGEKSFFGQSQGLSGQHRKHCKSTAAMILFLIVASFSGCKPYKIYHGHVIKNSELSALVIGRSTKDQVVRMLGSPTNILPYEPNTLYYLSHVVSSQSLLEIQPVSVKCYALVFSPSGILCQIVCSGEPYAMTPCPDSIPLPSKHNESFLEQMLRSFETNMANTTVKPV